MQLKLQNHGSDENEPAPLGSGIAVLMGLGAAYSWANAAERNKLKPNASENIRKRIGYIRVSSVREKIEKFSFHIVFDESRRRKLSALFCVFSFFRGEAVERKEFI